MLIFIQIDKYKINSEGMILPMICHESMSISVWNIISAALPTRTKCEDGKKINEKKGRKIQNGVNNRY